MTLQVQKVLTDLDWENYQKKLGSFSNCTPFYRTNWFSNLGTQFETLHYFLYSENGSPSVIMPFYLRKISLNNELTNYLDVCSPYGYSGPLFEKGIDHETIKSFWEEVDFWYQQNNVISEFLRFSLNDNHKYYSGKLIPTLENVRGKIVSPDEQWSKFKQKVRNNYRKAVAEDLRLEVYQNPMPEDILQTFFSIYTSTMERTNADKSYFFPLSYFEGFISTNQNNCYIAMVYKDNKAISTELILHSNEDLYSYLGGTLADFFNTRPNDFLKIEVMKWARSKGIKNYILGGGRTNNDGLFKYKKSFFPSENTVTYFTGRKIINEKVYNDLVQRRLKLDRLTEDFFPLYRG